MGPIYGQAVVGPPGSGKTTYCDGMQQYLRLLGRDAWVVNLDPANERSHGSRRDQSSSAEGKHSESQKNLLPYESCFDVCEEVVNLSSVMSETGLGPNGGLVYCMEYIEAHIDEIFEMLSERISSKSYLLFDLPGQVELYTHSTCVQSLLHRLADRLGLRLALVQLIDAYYCTDASKFLSASLLGTTTMLRLELPTVNVLSKVDLLARYGDLDFAFDFYTDCHDLHRLVDFTGQSGPDHGNDAFSLEDDILEDEELVQARKRRQSSASYQKFRKLHMGIAEVVEDFGLLAFVPLDVSDAESVGRVLARIDKCNGYVFIEGSAQTDLFRCAIQQDRSYDYLSDVKERIACDRQDLEEVMLWVGRVIHSPAEAL